MNCRDNNGCSLDLVLNQNQCFLPGNINYIPPVIPMTGELNHKIIIKLILQRLVN